MFSLLLSNELCRVCKLEITSIIRGIAVGGGAGYYSVTSSGLAIINRLYRKENSIVQRRRFIEGISA